jgi:hypothetical protein
MNCSFTHADPFSAVVSRDAAQRENPSLPAHPLHESDDDFRLREKREGAGLIGQ